MRGWSDIGITPENKGALVDAMAGLHAIESAVKERETLIPGSTGFPFFQQGNSRAQYYIDFIHKADMLFINGYANYINPSEIDNYTVGTWGGLWAWAELLNLLGIAEEDYNNFSGQLGYLFQKEMLWQQLQIVNEMYLTMPNHGYESFQYLNEQIDWTEYLPSGVNYLLLRSYDQYGGAEGKSEHAERTLLEIGVIGKSGEPPPVDIIKLRMNASVFYNLEYPFACSIDGLTPATPIDYAPDGFAFVLSEEVPWYNVTGDSLFLYHANQYITNDVTGAGYTCGSDVHIRPYLDYSNYFKYSKSEG